jgi:hypothetical protein
VHWNDPLVAVEQMRAKGLEPLDPYPGVNRHWRCQCTRCGAEVAPTLKNVRNAVFGCRPCGLRIGAEQRRSASHDQAVAEIMAVDLEPLEPYPGTVGAKWRCRCLRCGDEVSPDLKHIRRGQRACPRCAGNIVEPEAAAQVMREAGAEPLEPYPGSKPPWRCRCLTCGKEVRPNYNSVSKGQGVCVWCARRVVEEEEVAAVMRAAGFDPLEPYPGSIAPWLCRCRECSREISPSVATVRRRGHCCGYCSGNRVDPEEAEAVMRAAGYEPLAEYPGATEPWMCRCEKCGREVTTTYRNVSDGHGCGYCSRVRVDPIDAVAFMEAAGLKPLVPYPGATEAWPCRCTTCGNEVNPRWHNVSRGQGGCIYCAHGRRFDPAAPAWLYLLGHPEFRAWQVGITGRPDKRLEAHQRRGWHLVELFEFKLGCDALQAEAAIISGWRRQGFADAVPKSEMPQGGYTETVAWVNVPDITLVRVVTDFGGRQTDLK